MSSLCQQQEHIQDWHCRMQHAPGKESGASQGRKAFFFYRKLFSLSSEQCHSAFTASDFKPLLDLNLTVSIKRVPCPSCQLVLKKKITSNLDQILGHFITRDLDRVARSTAGFRSTLWVSCFLGTCALLSQGGSCSFKGFSGSCSFKGLKRTKAFLNYSLLKLHIQPVLPTHPRDTRHTGGLP